MADAHLSRAELVGWFDDGAGDRDRIIGHLAACAACRHAAAELERDRPAEATVPLRLRPEDFVAAGLRAGRPSARGPRGARRSAVYLAAAASLLIAAIVLPAWWREPPGPALRGADAVVTPLRPVGATLDLDSLVFEWTATPAAGALRLHVVSLDDAATPLIERDVSGARYEPSADERRRFQPGRDYHWFLEYRGAGAGAGTSAAARFRVR